jgi:hypothetical protein
MSARVYSRLTLSELVAVACAPEAAPLPAKAATPERATLSLRLLRQSRFRVTSAALLRVAAIGLALSSLMAIGFAGGIYGTRLIGGAPGWEAGPSPVKSSARPAAVAAPVPAETTSPRQVPAAAPAEARQPQPAAMLQGLADYQRIQLDAIAEEQRSPAAENTAPVAKQPGARREPTAYAGPRETAPRSQGPATPPRPGGNTWEAPGYTAR